jgi:hypothetical protein
VKLPPEQIEDIDLPALPETFADSLGMSSFDGQTMRLTFCVQRLQEPKPPKPPRAKKYPSCRLVITPNLVVDLFNQLNQIMGVMQQHGLVKVEPGKPPVAIDKGQIN